jgi:hypothetical protein
LGSDGCDSPRKIDAIRLSSSRSASVGLCMVVPSAGRGELQGACESYVRSFRTIARERTEVLLKNGIEVGAPNGIG